MTIKRDLSDLPKRSEGRTEGVNPDTEPRFAGILAERWQADKLAAGELPTAFPDARFRHSDAGGCARSIAFTALGLEPSDPMDLSGYWNTGIGSRVHDLWQDELRERYGSDVAIESKVRTDGAPGAGHIDAVVTMPSGTYEVEPDTGRGGFAETKTVAVELKTVGGFAFKMAVGERGAAQGPKTEHILQASLNALAVDADEAVIVYLAKEALSVNVAARKGFDELGRFTAEWTFSREQFEPWAKAEAERVAGIVALVDSGELPLRRFPYDVLDVKGHEIVDPKTGRWEVRDNGDVIDTGTFWACGYCKHQTRCRTTTPGRQPVSTVVEVAA